MEWTYLTYAIADYGISIGFILVAIIGVFATFFSSKKGEEFVIERLIGVNPIKAHDDYNEHDGRQHHLENHSLDNDEHHSESKQKYVQVKHRSIFYIGIFCCLLGGMTLSITAVLMFQGCFLTNTRLLPGDDCPEYPVDCFIFGHSSLAPITNTVSFVCERSAKAEFSTNISDATAWCYGWILRLQTTQSVLDQLGVSIALIGFFTTMLAVFVYLGKCKKTIMLSIMFISSCGGVIIVLLVFKWSFSPLTYAILALGMGLGIFGLILFHILPKPEKQKNNAQVLTADIHQLSVIPYSTLSYPKRSNPTAISSHPKRSNPTAISPYPKRSNPTTISSHPKRSNPTTISPYPKRSNPTAILSSRAKTWYPSSKVIPT